MHEMRSRRTFLRNMAGTMLGGAGVASTALPAGRSATSGHAIPPDLNDYDFFMARVKFEDDSRSDPWNFLPSGERYLLDELSKAVRCKVKRSGRGFNAIVDFNYADDLHKLPFLLMTAGGHFSFNDTQKQNFKSYVEQGGFILMDDCVSHPYPGDFFYHSSCQLLEHLFGKPALKEISTGHEIFHNVYDLSQIGMPYMHGVKWPTRRIFVGDRLAVLLTSTDLHCGWVDRSHGWFGGPNVRRRFGTGTHAYKEAIMMGINLIMYVLSH